MLNNLPEVYPLPPNVRYSTSCSMMLNPRSSVGVAQIAFYVPVLIAACILWLHKHSKPKTAWFALVLFSAGALTKPRLELR